MGRKRKDIVKKRRQKDGSLSKDWHYDWTIDGRRVRGSCETDQKDLAIEIALAERDKAVKRVKLGIDPEAEAERKRMEEGAEMTLAAACTRAYEEHWQYLKTSRDIRPAQCKTLMRIIGAATPLSGIDGETVRMFVARRRGEYATAGGRKRKKNPKLVSSYTVNRELDALATVIGHARGGPGKPGWKIDGAPVKVSDVNVRAWRLKEVANRTYLHQDRAISLLDVICAHAHGPAKLALLTGLRRGNVLGMQWEWVDLALRRVTLRVKGGETHTVSLIEEAVDLLEGLEPDPAKRRGPVFYFGNPSVGCDCPCCTTENKMGKKLAGKQIRSIKRAFDTARKAIGMPQLRFHDLRHTVASWLLGRGYTLEHIRKVLGHSDIATTQTYAHLEQHGLADAMADSLSLKVTNKSHRDAS